MWGLANLKFARSMEAGRPREELMLQPSVQRLSVGRNFSYSGDLNLFQVF